MATYIRGNVVKKETVFHPQSEGNIKEPARRAHTNRTGEVQMNRGYVIFLAVAAIVALFSCVKYLQLQSEITSRSKHITSLQRELSDAKEENTTRYNAVMNTMNLEEIRDIAMNTFGMVYATEDQIVKYQSPSGKSVTQYATIPESGIIASSNEVE